MTITRGDLEAFLAPKADDVVTTITAGELHEVLAEAEREAERDLQRAMTEAAL